MSWAAVAVAGATIVGGMMSAQQNAAAQSSANSANRAMSAAELAQQKEQFGQSVTIGDERARSKRVYGGEQLGGFSEAGQAANREQSALLGLGTPEEQEAAMSRFGDSPGQKFIRERAQKALLRNSAKLGGIGGGNVRSALVEQGTGFAAQDYGNQFNRLGTVANRGMVAGQTLTSQDLGVSDTAAGLNPAQVAAKAAAPAARTPYAQTPPITPRPGQSGFVGR